MSERLFEDFPPISTEAWRAQIEQDLKGAPLSKLAWENESGIALDVFYRAENLPEGLAGEFPASGLNRRGVHPWMYTEKPWEICLELPCGDLDAAAHALEALEHFPDAVRYVVPAGGPEGSGPQNVQDWERLLRPALAHGAAIHFNAHARFSRTYAWVENALANLGATAADVRGSAGACPFTVIGSSASAQEPMLNTLADALAVQIVSQAHFPGLRAYTLDLEPLSLAGANAVQEMAFALSMATELGERFGDDGEKVAEVFRNISFRFPVSTDFFGEIARFRAFRMLWAKVLEAYGLDASDPSFTHIAATGSRRQLSGIDAPTNILRASTQAMSAILGGADSVSVPAFDEVTALPNSLSLRLSINLQRVLRHESAFDKVIDPAGGSYYVELLTDKLAAKAWALFQEIEADGGYLAYLRAGKIEAALKAQAAKRATDINKGKITVLGVNQYPDFASSSNTADQLQGVKGRDSYPYEALKAQVSGLEHPLQAFLFTFGDLTMRQARANFAMNLLGCGGIRSIINPTPNDLEAGLEALAESNAHIVMLCSADAQYLADGPSLIQRIRKALPESIIVLAGRPQGWEALQADGLQDCIYMGMDRLAWLQKIIEPLSNMKGATHAS